MNKSTTRRPWVTVLTLLLVPLLLASTFLWGGARTDSGLRGVQAAIVNSDEMVTVNGQAMPMGRQLAAELVDSGREQNFTWVIATPEKAAEGLASGRYAAVVTIPREFSAAATSFSNPPNEAVRATIHVQTSPVAGLNEAALGGSIAEAATNALNRFVTGEYLKNIYVGFNDMHAQMLEMADGTRKLADGAGELADGADRSAAGSASLANGLEKASANSGTLRDGAAASASGATQLADGLGRASAGSAQLRDGVQRSTDGAGQLAGGARQLADGTRQWADGADRYVAGVETYTAGVGTLADGVDRYTGGVNRLAGGVRAAIEPLPEWAGWIDRAEQSVTDLSDRALAWDARAQAAIAETRAWVVRVNGLADSAASVRTGVAGLAERARQAGTVTCPTDLDEDACAAYQAGAAAASAKLADAVAPVRAHAASLADDSATLRTSGQTVVAALDRLSAASTEMVAWAPTAQAELARVKASVPAGTPRSKAEVLAFIDQFIAGGNELARGGRQLADNSGALVDGVRQLVSASHGLAAGADKLADGTDALASGLTQLDAGVRAYTGGVDQAATGARQLAGGLGQLTAGVDAYTGGIDQAAGGARQLSDGLGQLAGGADALATGTGTLADGVAEGVDDIPTYNETERDRLSEVVASPVDTAGFEMVTRPHLSWVSLLLVSALWMGALATFLVVGRPGRADALSTTSTGRLLRRSLLPGVGIVVAQGVGLAGLGALVLRLSLGEAALLGGVLVASAVAFALVNHALAALFGHGGRLAALVMALVTVVTAMTATAPGVLVSLGSLSPLTPALDGVRAVETTGQVTVTLFVLLGWAIVGLAASAAAIGRTRTVPLAAVVGESPRGRRAFG